MGDIYFEGVVNSYQIKSFLIKQKHLLVILKVQPIGNQHSRVLPAAFLGLPPSLIRDGSGAGARWLISTFTLRF